NDRMATAVAPFSPRGRAGAPVSMPLTWNQVKRGLEPMRYTLRTVPALLSKSAAWKDYCEGERRLLESLKRLKAGGQAASRETPHYECQVTVAHFRRAAGNSA